MDGKLAYDLKQPTFYRLVQQAVNDARKDGADYVVLLSHVGEQTQSMGFDSHRLIAATTGIDAVLDGHSHSVIPCDNVANQKGRIIGISQTGTQFVNVGKLLITPDGRFINTLIPTNEIPYDNAIVKATTDSVKTLMDQVVKRVVCSSPHDLVVMDKSTGLANVRFEETNAGDLVADMFRHKLSTDIALVNGGSIRTNVAAGELTFGDAVSLVPYDNMLLSVKATGAQIIELLQKNTAQAPAPDGNFPQASGIRFTIHNVSHTVSDIQVWDAATGNYVDIDPQKEYTLAITSYCKDSGFCEVLKNCQIIENTNLYMRDAFAEYLEKTLGGIIGPEYAKPQGRITVIKN